LNPGEFASLCVGTDTLVPVAARKDIALPRIDTARRSDARLPILAYSDESGLGRILRTLLGKALNEVRTELIFTAHLAGVLKTMALEGRGIAWLPVSLVEAELHTGSLVQAGTADWIVPVEIRLFRRHSVETPAVDTFWEIVKSTTQSEKERPQTPSKVRSRKSSLSRKKFA
jgi:DNA-binding transcriptional LysR family regulator